MPLRTSAGFQAEIQIDGADVSPDNPLPVQVFDGEGDSVANDATNSINVNIVGGAGAGGTSMVDDAPFTPGVTGITPAGAMFDDVAPDLVDEGDGGVVRMSENRNLYVRIRDDAGNERGLNVDAGGNIGVTDAGGSLTVDNPALAVVGGGVEVAALRVTIANDSTGLLSVDDNGGSLTVDAAGDVAHDAVDAGNPVKVGAYAVETDGTSPGSVSAEADRTNLKADRDGRLLVNTGHPFAWKTNNNYAAAQTNAVQIAAPGANLSLYITSIVLSTDTTMNMRIVSNTGAPVLELGPYYFVSNGGMVAASFSTPVRIAPNTDLGFTSSVPGNHTVTLVGYTAP